MKKKYFIYSQGKCIYENLSEREFKQTWDMIHKFISITQCVEEQDLEYKVIDIV